MFEKYKVLKGKRDHFGMSKREYYKFLFMILLALVCLVVLTLDWGLSRKEGHEVEIPVRDALVPPGRDELDKAGDRGAREKFTAELEKLLKERKEKAADTGEVALPEIPKPPAPWEPDPQVWQQVDDGAKDVVEEQVVLYVLHQLNSMTQDEVRKKVHEDADIPVSDFSTYPAEHRGKFVSVTGTLLFLENQVLAPNRSGLNQYWCGLLYNQRSPIYRRFYFYIFDKDREWLTQMDARSRDLARYGDLVTLHGVFVKMYRSTTEGGKEAIYPFIIGRNLEPARPLTARQQYPWPLLAGVGVIFGGVIVFLVVATRRDRKEEDSFARTRIHKKAALVSNELARKAAARGKTKDPANAPPADAGAQQQAHVKPHTNADEPGGGDASAAASQADELK